MRNASIDTFRFIAIIFVVLGHVSMDGGDYFGIIITQSANFTVAFFFIVSGYFIYKHASGDVDNVYKYIIKYDLRLIIIYLFWYFIYMFLPFISPDVWDNIAQNGLIEPFHDWFAQFIGKASTHLINYTIVGGYGYHLWFFHALVMASILLAISIKYNILNYGFIFSIVLYIVGLLLGPYKETYLGIPIGIDPRDGPFSSSIFVFIGALLYKHKLKISIKTALLIAATGFIIVLLEVLIIRKYYGIYDKYYDFVTGTIPYATGIAFVAIAKNNIGVKYHINSLAKYTLGIYVSHVLVLNLLMAFDIWPEFNIFKLILTVFVSILVTKVFLTVPPLRRFVS